MVKNKSSQKPLALILAGYDKLDLKTRKKKQEEIQKAYNESLFIGRNKFLQKINDKPIIKYVLDAVYNSRIGDEPIYETIYVYNDMKTFHNHIDVSKYDNLQVKQMKKSVAGHLKDFYENHVEYGRQVDIFFGDTPRITSEDVEWIHGEYKKILGKEKDSRGVTVNLIFGLARYRDMEDNWIKKRMNTYKRGKYRGKPKFFVNFEEADARIGNAASFIKDHSQDGIIEKKVIDLFYGMRKALTVSNISKILYYLWKTGNLDVVKQVKNRSINLDQAYRAGIEVAAKTYRIDLTDFAAKFLFISNNAARWENDIDGPRDMKVMRERLRDQRG